jgi:aminodeoxyfutalosine deaminase
VWDPLGLAKSPEHVLRLAAGAGPTLFVHANYLAASAALPANASVVYCPRTHAAFGHAPHPFRDLMARGVRVCLGTDSLASNPDLSLLAEMRFLRATHPDLPGEQILRIATLAGAEALGWADETGSLEEGKSADLVVLPLPAHEALEPHDLWLEDDAEVSETWFRGVRC